MGQPKGDDVEVGTQACRACGAVYHVTLRHRPQRIHDWYNCAICGQLMMEWDSSDVPCFTLVGPRPGYPPRKPR